MRTYISLFSSAGIGCYGFKQEGFECIATCELLERRIKMQAFNKKCRYEAGYICGDMSDATVQDKVITQYNFWKKYHNITDVDVVVATPPCQGMSVANHKKTDESKELKRNSLVIESIKMIQRLMPKFFVIENVRSFLTTGCLDIDDKFKSIEDAIIFNLSGLYNIYARVVNFKDYGNLSSRPRTLVIGSRKDLKDINPLLVFPDRQKEKTLREVIGHLPSLTKMGEMWSEDFYHQFKPYDPRMEAWIAPLSEGQSAFDNEDERLRPHQIINGEFVPNVKKNGDKYTRCYWDKVAPCIHTRNDILASQNTIHPSDNRVFSIRELMLLMSVPSSYQWSDKPFEELQKMTDEEKRIFLKREEINIRQNLGEAVPTIIFRQIAHKINEILDKGTVTVAEVDQIIIDNNLTNIDALKQYVDNHQDLGFVSLSKIAELANAQRENNAAYYTSQDICFSVIKYLPDYLDSATINILEPSVGLGNFLPSIFVKYSNLKRVNLDVCDIDGNSIELLKELIKKLNVPSNFRINYINADTLINQFRKHYDIVLGNPPYMKFKGDKQLFAHYRFFAFNQETNNLFAFFIEKAMQLADYVAMIVPKSLINAPEFNATRELMNRVQISHLIDYGEKAFKGVKIETISFVLNTKKRPGTTIVESFITKEIIKHKQSYITDSAFPYWLIYRNNFFDNIASKLNFNIFTAYRDRAITKKHTRSEGKYRVLKSRNIGSNEIIDIPGYDCYMDDISEFGVSKYLNADNCYLVPNLTYYPRACKMPQNCIADGSVAILIPKNVGTTISEEDLAYFATEEFTDFYKIARNNGTRSLNIDNNSVFFFGTIKNRIMTIREKINQHLNRFDLDVRKSGDARFSDQKCTPDVVCFIADCIINAIGEDKWFVVNDIWQSNYFIKNVRAIYGKPYATDVRAKHEYDKFIQQPLRMLAYAHVLDIVKGIPNTYRISNFEILEYISLKERNSYNFLYCYFEKVLKDSEQWTYFEQFVKEPSKETFENLKERFDKFMIGFTPINTAVEVHRIFPKILNVIAVENNIQGMERGHISKYAFSFSDLMYNRKNWRDLNKDKAISRQEARETEDVEQQEAFNNYYVQKAIALIRKIQTDSEVHDQYSQGAATQVHHIFPKSKYPQIAHYLENLILLTATQHFTQAHPNNNTQTINKDYQLTCLLAKADTIKKSLQTVGDKYYRKESFVYVINTGLETAVFLTTESFEDIKTKLIQFYNAA